MRWKRGLQLGKRMRPPQRQNLLLYQGISVFDSIAALEERRQRVLDLGHHFPGLNAEVHIPDGAPVQIHKTLGVGHYSLVGDSDQVLGYVVRLV